MMSGLITETIAVAGLSRAAKICVDRWGIPHISADTQDDLFLAQGFNAARDRLWQIDLWRKRGLGRLAADFGPGYLAQDHASRLFLFRGDMAAEWTSYAPDARSICEAFVAGINAYVALTEQEPARLPPEFALLGTRPARWNAEDVVRIRSHALVRNATSEVLRANVLRRADARTDLLRRSLDPFVVAELADGVALDDIPLTVLDLYKLATAPVTFEPARLAATLDEAQVWRKVTDLGDVVRMVEEEGSNNWVVSGARTATGRPILASDPHRTHTVPSLRYLVHLTMPGFDAIGTGEPVVPGLSFGHNGQTAFGLTIHGADQEDIYVYETHPDDAGLYRYRGEWRRLDRVEDVFRVKGVADQRRVLSFSVHGPVLHEDRARCRAVALRSVWFEPGTAAYLGSLSAMRARSVHEFGATLGTWGAPSVNHVCADVSGAIGWFTAGRTPIRSSWKGLLPVPGDGRFEWSGFMAAAELAHSVNPAAGFLATANEMNLPADWPQDEKPIGYEWTDNSRAARIQAILETADEHTVEASCRLQNDVRSRPAERICRVATILPPANEDVARGLALLRGWNGDLAAASGAAALFEVWWMLHLRPALLLVLSGNPAVIPLLVPGDIATLVDVVENPDERFGPQPARDRDQLMLKTLADAMRDCERRLGTEMSAWAWGRLHHGYFQHAASPITDGGETSKWDVGPLPLGGSQSTVMNTGYRISDFRCNTGASVRLVMDVGAWDNSVCINAPGQSGHPQSPHYGDLAPLWAAGGYVPLLYSRMRIIQATTTVISLVPDGATSTLGIKPKSWSWGV
jgi:penicillin amidase